MLTIFIDFYWLFDKNKIAANTESEEWACGLRVLLCVIIRLTCWYFLLQLFIMRQTTLIEIFVIFIKILQIQTDGEFLYFNLFSVLSKGSRCSATCSATINRDELSQKFQVKVWVRESESDHLALFLVRCVSRNFCDDDGFVSSFKSNKLKFTQDSRGLIVSLCCWKCRLSYLLLLRTVSMGRKIGSEFAALTKSFSFKTIELSDKMNQLR